MRIALLLSCLLPYAARADQCAVVDDGLKPKVLELLEPGRRYVEWCEPCHESAPGPIKVIEQIDLAALARGSLALHVNDRDADLAYLFVETMPGSGRFVNAAKAVSCPAHDVSAEVNPKASDDFDGTWSLQLTLVGRGCSQRPALDSLSVQGERQPQVSSAEGRWSAEKSSEGQLVLAQPVANGLSRKLTLHRDGDVIDGTFDDVRAGAKCQQHFAVHGTLAAQRHAAGQP